MLAGLVLVSSSALAQTDGMAQVDARVQGCAAGGFEDCRWLLLRVELGRTPVPDVDGTFAAVFDKARAIFEGACDRGDATESGCFGAGFVHEIKRPGDLARAITFYERSCSGRYAAGCTQLGNAYTAGIDAAVPWDIQRALAAYERACAAGDPAGCTTVAKVLEGAADVPPEAVRRVPRDLKRAASLYQKACDMGAMPDCLRLAQMYEGGLGVRKDAARAAELSARACEGGVKDACARDRTRR